MMRNICIAVILILCIAGAASALPLDPEMAEAERGEAGLLGGLWDKFLHWIDQMAGREGGGGLTALEMDGCHLDPNGGHCGGGS
jgi:hypothetical protein